MKKLLKPVLIATPAILALAACDAPPAEDPATSMEDGSEMIGAPIEEPLDTAPMGEAAPVDGNLTGGEAPVDEVAPTDEAMPDTGNANPPAGEDSMTEENAEVPPATE